MDPPSKNKHEKTVMAIQAAIDITVVDNIVLANFFELLSRPYPFSFHTEHGISEITNIIYSEGQEDILDFILTLNAELLLFGVSNQDLDNIIRSGEQALESVLLSKSIKDILNLRNRTIFRQKKIDVLKNTLYILRLYVSVAVKKLSIKMKQNEV
jgi:uncharacterized membrane protein YhfC